MSISDDFNAALARDIVARRVASRLIDEDALGVLWEDYPEIGEHDWVAVTKQAEHIAERLNPSDDQYTAAYFYLASMASDEA